MLCVWFHSWTGWDKYCKMFAQGLLLSCFGRRGSVNKKWGGRMRVGDSVGQLQPSEDENYISELFFSTGFLNWVSQLNFSKTIHNCFSQLDFSIGFLNWISQLFFSTVFFQLFFSTGFLNWISQRNFSTFFSQLDFSKKSQLDFSTGFINNFSQIFFSTGFLNTPATKRFSTQTKCLYWIEKTQQTIKFFLVITSSRPALRACSFW